MRGAQRGQLSHTKIKHMALLLGTSPNSPFYIIECETLQKWFLFPWHIYYAGYQLQPQLFLEYLSEHL